MAGITAELGLDASQFNAAIGKAQGTLRTFKARSETTGRAASRGMFGGFGRAANEAGELIAGSIAGRSPAALLHRHFDELGRVLGPALVGGLAAVGIGSQVVGAVRRAMSAETMEISMEVLIGDASKARQTISELRRMAAQTPYEFPDLADATRTLLGFGIANEDILPTISRVSEIAQGNAATLDRLALVYGQISAAGRLMGQDVLQLINAGFNPLQIISQKTGESMLQLKKRMEDGAISFEEVRDAFISVTGVGGRFYQMNQRQSKTTAGLLSTLRDAYGEVQLAFAKPLNTALNPVIQSAISLLKSLQDEAEEMGAALSSAFTGSVNILQSVLGSADWTKGAFGGVMDIITPLANLLGAEIELALVRAANAFINVLRDFAGEFGPELGNGIVQIMNVLESMVDGLLASFESIFRRIGDQLDPNRSHIGKTTDAIANSFQGERAARRDAFLSSSMVPTKFLDSFARGSRQMFDEAARRAEIEFINGGLGAGGSEAFMGGLPSPSQLGIGGPAQAGTGTATATAANTAAQMAGRPVGAMASAINLIMGRSANELIYDEAKKQTALAQQQRDLLSRIDKNTAKPQQQQAQPVVIDMTPRFARP
ncbi:hypothetical protein EBZ39_02960 [bacterium]|nr:hypothetical protein [bacterium]